MAEGDSIMTAAQKNKSFAKYLAYQIDKGNMTEKWVKAKFPEYWPMVQEILADEFGSIPTI